jgi:hypothetical protein
MRALTWRETDAESLLQVWGYLGLATRLSLDAR